MAARRMKSAGSRSSAIPVSPSIDTITANLSAVSAPGRSGLGDGDLRDGRQFDASVIANVIGEPRVDPVTYLVAHRRVELGHRLAQPRREVELRVPPVVEA